MTKVKLCKGQITVDQHLGVVPNGLQVKIYVNDKTLIQTGVTVKEQILNNQAVVERIREKINELDEFQQGYFFENPGRHRNDEEISSLYNFLGEKFTPTTFEEDRQQFLDTMNKQKTMDHLKAPQQNFSKVSKN